MHNDEERLYDPRNHDDNAITEDIASTDDTDSINTTTASTVSLEQPPDQFKRLFLLEPAIFLIFLAISLTGAVIQNQILYQSCIAIFHYNASDCQPLLGVSAETKSEQQIINEVQTYSSQLLMARALLESVIPTFLSLLIGPWSDKFGRRPVLLTACAAYFASYGISTILFAISNSVLLSPWFYLLSSVPTVLSGGICSFITGICAHISDVADGRARIIRMFLIEVSLGAGLAIGSIVCGYIYAATSVVTVLLISTVLAFLAFLYVYLYMQEGTKFEEAYEGSKIREFFRFGLIKGLVRTCLERRPKYDRAIIWLTMLSSATAVFAIQGDATVTYFFLSKKFDVTVKTYSLFNASSIGIQIVGGLIAMILFKKIFKFSIVSLILIAFGCCVLESTVRATAVYWWEIYLGMTLGSMRGLMSPMLRAVLSHVTPTHQVGKIFALATLMETLAPFGAAPLYTTVYNATLVLNPSAFNFISAGLYLLCYTFVSAIFGIQIKLGTAIGSFGIGDTK